MVNSNHVTLFSAIVLFFVHSSGLAQVNTDKMNISKARVAIENSDYDAAKKYLSSVSESAKDKADYLDLSAKISLHYKDYEAAVKVYYKLFELTGNDTLMDAIARVNYLLESQQDKQKKMDVFNNLMSECPKFFYSVGNSGYKYSDKLEFSMSDGSILKLHYLLAKIDNSWTNFRAIGTHYSKLIFDFERDSKPIKVCLGDGKGDDYSKDKIKFTLTNQLDESVSSIVPYSNKRCDKSYSTSSFTYNKWGKYGVNKYPIGQIMIGRGTNPALGKEIDGLQQKIIDSYLSPIRVKSIKIKTDEYINSGTINSEDAEKLHKICHCILIGNIW